MPSKKTSGNKTPDSHTTSRPIRVLIIENDPAYADLLKRILSEEKSPSFEVECSRLRRLVDFSNISTNTADILLVDIPDRSRFHVISQLHEAVPEVPIVVLTDFKDQALALETVRKGAQDYLVKSDVNAKMLSRVIRYAIERTRSERQLRKAQIKNEQLLSSITSILIEVNPEGQITHWNAIAENTFGLMAPEVIGKKFQECAVQWDAASLWKGVTDCKVKNRPVRLDNFRFVRTDSYEGILGFTIIPMHGTGGKEATEFLLFGADVTERNRLARLKDEFVSTVSHELRTPLTIIREGVSQVLEGILGKITDEQKQFLGMSLEAIDRLTRIVNDLLDMAKIEAGKMELKKELVDVVEVAKHVVDSFQARVRNSPLELHTRFPDKKILIFADRDKMIQIFTNLIHNAFKFTEKGSIEVAVQEHPHSVECSISDTGKGISREDREKLFSKFQQFGRTHGPGEKGTGLGLAICKGLVEMHYGRISVQSKPGRGTQFSFSLPKHGAKDLFRECVEQGVRDAMKKGDVMSLVAFNIRNFEQLEKRLGVQKAALFLSRWEDLVRRNLNQQANVQLNGTQSVLVVLPATQKEDALILAGRMRQIFEQDLSQKSLERQIQLSCKVACFPEDATTGEGLLEKAFSPS